MKRREFLGTGLALAAGWAFPVGLAAAERVRRVRPGDPDWPSPQQWAALKRETGGRLSPVSLPTLDAAQAKELLSNPFYVGDQPGLTQSSGWLDAWRSSPSAYAVAAESAGDVAAAVRFARVHNLRLVVRGGGHSYLGTSSAPDSLMVWTRRLNTVIVHDAFTPAGAGAAPVPAVSLGAGCVWLHAYRAVTGGAGRYVQGGGCTTVGVAGLVQGGGFGSFSKAFGTAAASLLEAEVVTADGKIRVVNHAREPDLFWAIKGGGGGTFGVVTRLTLATHDLPTTFGAVVLKIRARSGEAYRKLLAQFVELYAQKLFNPHWGEQAHAGPNNTLEIRMVFQGIGADEARAVWKPLTVFADAGADQYEGQKSFLVLELPARDFWDLKALRRAAPSVVRVDRRAGAMAGDFWWAGNQDEVRAYWHAYTSAWMPASLLKPPNRDRLVDAWFAASRHWTVSFHFNKGLAGAAARVIEAARDTAINPDALDAFALAIIASSGPEADQASARANRGRVQAAMTALRAAAPNAGTYLNECDYFLRDWQTALWGPNYPRLAAIKRRYDPDELFVVHHGVGSENWSADGFTRLP